MRAAPDPAVKDHIDSVAYGVHDLRNLIKGVSRAVQLPPAMVGDHDRCRANIRRPPGVRGTHNAFETELSAPPLAEFFRVLPVHRLVEHRGKVVAHGDREVVSRSWWK